MKLKKVSVSLLAVVLGLGLFSGGAGKVYASGNDKEIIVLNGDKTIENPDDAEYIVKGKGTLTIEGDWEASGIKIDENANVVVKDGYMDVSEGLYVGKNASLKVNYSSTDGSTPVLYVGGNFDVYGNVTINSNDMGPKLDDGTLNIYGNLTITNTGEQLGLNLNRGALNVYSGNLNMNAPSACGISANSLNKNRLNIISGNVTINCKSEAINVEDLFIDGGNINLTVSDEGVLVLTRKPMTISDYVVVETPQNLKIDNLKGKTVGESTYKSDVYSIFDNDKVATKFVTREKEKPKGYAGGGSSAGGSAGKGSASSATKPKYANEWVDGKWYNSQGVSNYDGKLTWKCNSTGWWVEDSSGWYPVSQWQKIDGKWYYFTESGYMDYSEYRDGYWLGADGALVDGYYGQWRNDSKGWWFEDISGWYPASQWLWIDGTNYYFDSEGYTQ